MKPDTRERTEKFREIFRHEAALFGSTSAVVVPIRCFARNLIRGISDPFDFRFLSIDSSLSARICETNNLGGSLTKRLANRLIELFDDHAFSVRRIVFLTDARVIDTLSRQGARRLPRTGKERRLGIWAECVPHDRREEIYDVLRTQGMQCDVSAPDATTDRVEVLCSDGEAIVRLRISPTRVTVVLATARASVERAFVVRLGKTGDRTWRQRSLDRRLLARIKAALVPFGEAEDEIEKTAFSRKPRTPRNPMSC